MTSPAGVVTDPDLIAQLEAASGAKNDPNVVTDPALIKNLESKSRAQPTATDTLGDFIAGLWRGGVTKPVDAGAQMLSRGVQAAVPAASAPGSQGPVRLAPMPTATNAIRSFADDQRASTDQSVMKNQADFQRNYGNSTPAKVGEFAGTIGSGVALGLAAPAGVPGAIAAGALGGLAEPVQYSPESGAGTGKGDNAPAGPNLGTGAGSGGAGGSFLTDKAIQASTGALIGGAAGLVGKGIAKVLTPADRATVDALREGGVTPSLGQTAGGWINAAEQKLMSVPGLGDVISNVRGKALDQWNRLLANRALAPIGEKLEASTAAGRDAVDEVATKIGAVYDKLTPQLSAKADGQFLMDMQGLKSLTTNMVPERAKQFAAILDQEVVRRFNPQTKTMTGESLNEAQSALGRLASEYRGSASADERALGSALRQAQENLLSLLERSNPQAAEALGAAKAAWRQYVTYADAAQRAGSKEGVVTPATLTAAVKKGDNSLGDRQFARGRANGQDFAEASRRVLGATYPDSGTAGRVFLGGALGSIPSILAGTGNLGPALGAAGAYGAAMLPYLMPKTSAALFGGRPAAGILASIPYAGAAAGRVASGGQ